MASLMPDFVWGAPVTALPGPADAGRIDQREFSPLPPPPLSAPVVPAPIVPNANAPEASKNVTLTLREVHITGMTAFTPDEIKDIYAPYVGHEITLDTVWVIAAQLTQRYHNEGYFLSRAVVPQQQVKDGIVTLHVIEGYVGEVKLDDPLAQQRLVKAWIDRLQSYHPLRTDQIESVLLHLNDLPGVDLHAVLEPIDSPSNSDGAVRLVLERKQDAFVSGFIGFDNNSSRFLGPYEANAQAQMVLIPLEKTTFSTMGAFPLKELRYGGVKQEIPLFESATLELYASQTAAQPGYTLKAEDIKSVSTIVGAAFTYSVIRQRDENLNARFALEKQDSDSNILGAPLTRDAIRTARLGFNYQLADRWNGQNTINTTASRGIDVLGSSPAGQLNLSREGAKPDFTKVNLDISRLQALTPSWDLFAAASGQLASGPLYSSEQFGYGGQAFGRAYDDSEMTGDEGGSVAAELRYKGLRAWHQMQLVPYEFYDLGAVWNEGGDQTMPYASGSSAGAGFKLFSDFGIYGNVGLAFPLTRPVETPLYGNSRNPRYFLQCLYAF